MERGNIDSDLLPRRIVRLEADAGRHPRPRRLPDGDTANKIGTYGLAVAARHHGIPLYVVAPSTRLDPAAATGAEIPIEERHPMEVSHRYPARNPAFDVTPAELIAAIVTEEGVHRAPYAEAPQQAVPA